MEPEKIKADRWERPAFLRWSACGSLIEALGVGRASTNGLGTVGGLGM